MKKIILVLVLMFSCNVAWGEDSLRVSNGSQLIFQTNNNVSLLEIDSDGNVVGGVLHPIYKLVDRLDAQQKQIDELKARIVELEIIEEYEVDE